MKGWPIKPLVFVALGAIVNLLVAWGLAACTSDYATRHGWAQVGGSQWSGGAGQSVGGYWFQSNWNKYGRTGAYGEKYDQIVPNWSPVSDDPPDWFREVGSSAREDHLVDAHGWPCLAFLGWIRWRHFGNVIEDRLAGFEPGIAAGMVRTRTVLPTRPIWPGFAVNTLFYAAILWLLMFGQFAMRRAIRMRRGLCLACGYPIGERDVCTECGKPVTPGRNEGIR
jgi:hypothetical protein